MAAGSRRLVGVRRLGGAIGVALVGSSPFPSFSRVRGTQLAKEEESVVRQSFATSRGSRKHSSKAHAVHVVGAMLSMFSVRRRRGRLSDCRVLPPGHQFGLSAAQPRCCFGKETGDLWQRVGRVWEPMGELQLGIWGRAGPGTRQAPLTALESRGQLAGLGRS
jgi:hypothetical protein